MPRELALPVELSNQNCVSTPQNPVDDSIGQILGKVGSPASIRTTKPVGMAHPDRARNDDLRS
jgi:hypothetical protein